MNICKDCGDILEVGDNWTEAAERNYRYLCKPCTNKRSRVKKHTMKLDAIEYLGSKCQDCGQDDYHPSVYEFHHLDPSTKTASPSNIIRSSNREALFKELDKCVLLCANCHRIRHYEERRDTYE